MDTVAPQTQYVASPAPNGNGSNSTDVAVTLTTTDDTAVTAFTYPLDGGPSLPVPGSGVIPVTTDGVHNLSWAAKDAGGNTATGQFLVSVTEPYDVNAHLAQLRELVSLSPVDEVLRAKLLNDLTLLEKAYEKGRGATKGCKELGDLQLRVTTATSIQSGTKAVILDRAGELGC